MLGVAAFHLFEECRHRLIFLERDDKLYDVLCVDVGTSDNVPLHGDGGRKTADGFRRK